MSPEALNFELATDSEIATFAEAHAREFDCDLDKLEIIAAIVEGRSILVRRPYGFALVQIVNGTLPHLWLLYIAPAHRGNGLGRRFVREIVDEFGSSYHMTLRCAGPQRRKFFGRCGFVVESRDGEWRRMTTDREHWKWGAN